MDGFILKNRFKNGRKNFGGFTMTIFIPDLHINKFSFAKEIGLLRSLKLS